MQPLSALSNSCFCPGSPSAGGLLPAGSGCVGAGGSHRIQGNHSGQPAAVYRRLRPPGLGRHALSAGLPGLLRSHSRKQMSPSLRESKRRICS